MVVYGLSTEGYAIACQMALRGADVHIIDESTPSAISLKSEIAKTYPDVLSLKEDEPLLAMEPIDVAISKASYLFFTPRIRRTGQDTKTEIHSKFKDAITPLKKKSSVVFCLPTGFGGNNENISLLEHVTGFEAGKSISYYYYPLADMQSQPSVVGSFNSNADKQLDELLSEPKKTKRFIALSSSEYFHAINTLSRFSRMCSILEVCRFAQSDVEKSDLSSDNFQDIYLNDIASGSYDLNSLATSSEGSNILTYLINGSIKGIDGYIKYLIDVIRATLKNNDLKASRTKIVLSWSIDRHEMRGDRLDKLNDLTKRLRDHIGDVETFDEPSFDMFHSDKTTIVVACSKADHDKIEKKKKNSELIVIKANPLCDIIQ